MGYTASQAFLLRFSRFASDVVVGIGMLVLAGWIFDVQVLKSVSAHFVAMTPFSAVLFVLSGFTLRRLIFRPGDRVARICAFIVALGGAVRLVEYFFDLDMNLDTLLFRHGLQPPAKIALNSALNFFLTGTGLLLFDVETRRGFRPAQPFMLAGALVALLALIGYAYRVLPLYRIGATMPMPLNSAADSELLCLAALAARPDRGIMKIVTSDTTGGAMVRRLLPPAILIPLVVGAVCLLWQERGYLDADFSLSLFTIASIVVFAALIWWNAKLLFRAEHERQQAMERLKVTGAELERSNTELQQFAYVASHDLTEPLRMIASYLELLRSRSGEKLDAESREFIGYAVDGAKRMQTLIADLLEYARVDTRGRPFEPTSGERVLPAALANLKVAIQESHAVVDHGPLPTVKADSGQLTQLFQNLIGNAIKFHGPAAPRIHVGAEREGDAWKFRVADNGIGIDTRNFDRIFVLFQRLHSRREYAGTGMGLAICKKIVERHGGRIWVESKPGEGATFFFTMPAV